MGSAEIDSFDQGDDFVQRHFVRADDPDLLQQDQRAGEILCGGLGLHFQLHHVPVRATDLFLKLPNLRVMPGGGAVAVQQLVEQRARLAFELRVRGDQLVCPEPEIFGRVGESRTGGVDCVGHT